MPKPLAPPAPHLVEEARGHLAIPGQALPAGKSSEYYWAASLLQLEKIDKDIVEWATRHDHANRYPDDFSVSLREEIYDFLQELREQRLKLVEREAIMARAVDLDRKRAELEALRDGPPEIHPTFTRHRPKPDQS